MTLALLINTVAVAVPVVGPLTLVVVPGIALAINARLLFTSELRASVPETKLIRLASMPTIYLYPTSSLILPYTTALTLLQYALLAR